MSTTTSHHDFSGNYMVLRPEEVSYFGLLRILWNGALERKAYVQYPTGKEENLHRRRRIIFLSLLVQKFLQSMANPITWFGSALEMWLNLLTCNRNIFILFKNALQGKVIMPVKGSQTFMSAFGYLDKRVHLDKNAVKPDEDINIYYSALSVMAAKISYENKAFVQNTVKNLWKMELLGYYDFWNDFQRKLTTQAFMLHDKNTDPDLVVVAFRGTEPFDADAWCTDFDVSWYEFPAMGKIHGGFMKALGLLMYEGWPAELKQGDNRPIAYYTIREKLREIFKRNDRTKFILTGHSMGGALAILFPAVLAMHGETGLLKRLEGVYTFGQPRVGDERFKRLMKNLLQTYGFKYLRFVYCNDVVPRLPMDDSTFSFKHFGTCLYYNSCYHGRVVLEEPNKNYISMFAPIPRFLNAIWELARSFIMPYTMGPDYRESWLLKLVRMFGLIIPGLAAHNPQDYVNTTRLGPNSIYLRVGDHHLRSVSNLIQRKIDNDCFDDSVEVD